MSTEVDLTNRVFATANYSNLPSEVPPGVTRIDRLTTDCDASVGVGLFDGRGHGYSSPGFRGISGSERREVFVALDGATPGFTPGPIEPGTWTIIVPVFLPLLPTEVTVRVRLTTGTPVAPPHCCRAGCRASYGKGMRGTAATCTVTPRRVRTHGRAVRR